MIAVIEVGGKQFIVKQGDTITVDRLDDAQKTHTFVPLLVSDEAGETTIGTPTIAGSKVECKVLEHVRDDKVLVFKMKSKKHYHRKRGFRAAQTKLEVTSIGA